MKARKAVKPRCSGHLPTVGRGSGNGCRHCGAGTDGPRTGGYPPGTGTRPCPPASPPGGARLPYRPTAPAPHSRPAGRAASPPGGRGRAPWIPCPGATGSPAGRPPAAPGRRKGPPLPSRIVCGGSYSMVKARYSCSAKIVLTIWWENVIRDRDTRPSARS